MEFYRIWRILLGYKWVLLWLPLVSTFIGLGLTYALPEQYESTALVLVRPFESIEFNSGAGGRKEILDFPVSQSTPIDAPSKTYMEVIKSTAVAEKIVEALDLHVEVPEEYEGWLDALKDEFKNFVKNSIRTIRHYSKYGREIPATPFERAVEDIEQKLSVAVRKNTYAFDITYRSGNSREAADVANMAAEIFLEHSGEAYRSESAGTREFLEQQLEESREALAQARADLLAFKGAGDTFALSSEYSEKLKNVSDLENTLAKTKSDVARLRKIYSAGNPNLTSVEAEKTELEAQVASLHEELAAYAGKERDLNSLVLAVKLTEESFELFNRKYEESRVKESSNLSEIRIISRATPALYPVKPIKYIYAGLSFALALVLACGYALFFEYLDPRVRTVGDLEEGLGLPILGAIPSLKRSGSRVVT